MFNAHNYTKRTIKIFLLKTFLKNEANKSFNIEGQDNAHVIAF